jgi:OmpA-OmpF porin, OOP family
MRCNPLRWLWGLLPLALLSWLTGFTQHRPIEADLKRAVEVQLRQQGLGWANIAFEAREGVLTGKAADEAEQKRAYDIAASTWGVRTVENKTELIEKADSYTWWARRDGDRVVLNGLAPNAATKDSVIETARTIFAGRPVIDQMRLARGAPNTDTWLTGLTFGMRQLAQLRSGEARLDGLGLSVSGEAPTEPVYRSVKSACPAGSGSSKTKSPRPS